MDIVKPMNEHGAKLGDSPLVEVTDLKKYFPVMRGVLRKPKAFVHAVDGITFSIKPRESLGLVGESGSGKSTTGKLLLRLLEPTEGHISMRNGDNQLLEVNRLRGREMKQFRRRAQMIFQDPYESMNPRKTVYDSVSEPLSVQHVGSLQERETKVSEMLGVVGLTPVSRFLFRYPHELSGGQRQRVAIARALIHHPVFVVADEPTSMLDASVRTEIMKLMLDLADRFNVSYLYITHDLAVARYMCDRIAVMYLGKIVEMAETEELLNNPLHPYTKALISAVPVPDPSYKRTPLDIRGGIPKPVDPHPRCRFYDRCPLADEECKDNDHPPLMNKGGNHWVACYKV